MNLEESIRVLNRYMYRIDIKAELIVLDPQKHLNSGVLNYQSLRIEVGVFFR